MEGNFGFAFELPVDGVLGAEAKGSFDDFVDIDLATSFVVGAEEVFGDRNRDIGCLDSRSTETNGKGEALFFHVTMDGRLSGFVVSHPRGKNKDAARMGTR